MPMSSGSRLGPYEIVAQIGAGGMGEVYRALDTRLDRFVAIKILPSEFAHDARLKIRFEREARVISQLSHPNICTLFDVGDNYIVMELLDGDSLGDRLARGALSLPDVLRYGAEIAEALGKAHREGVVHRDLKPGNIMITKSGAKLLDFGLAKSTIARAASVESATAQKPLTAEGMVVGTFQYMAPEQLAGEEPDARTDIFALGAVLYEMTTGKRAFEGKTRTSLVAAIVSGEPPPIRQLQPLTPPALEHVVKKCLTKDRDDRWQSAADVAEELRWIQQASSEAGVAAPVIARRKLRGGLVFAVVAAALVGVTFFIARRPSPPLVNHRYAIPSTTSDYDDALLTQISPDGRHFLITGFKDGIQKEWIRDVESITVRTIPGADRRTAGLMPQFSPDGRFIYFFSDDFLDRVSIDGGTPEHLVAATGARWPTINASGVVLFDKDRGIFKWAPGDRAPAVLLRPDPNGDERFAYARFLPDGKHFLFTLQRRTSEGLNSGAIQAASLDGKERLTVVNARSRAVYAPPGYLLFGRGRKLVAVPFDADRLRITGSEIIVADDVNASEAWIAFSVSNTGVLTYRPTADHVQLLWRSAEGKELGSFGELGAFNSAAISPDGRALAASLEDRDSGKNAIWILGIDRPTSTRATFERENATNPVWIDNRRFAYTYFATGAWASEIRLQSVDQPSAAAEILVSGARCLPIEATRRGTLLYLQRRPGEKQEMWEVSLAAPHIKRPFLRAPFDIGEGGLSPDGKWLLHASSESGRDELYMRRFDDGSAKTQVTTAGVSKGFWSADGKSIIYSQANDVYSVSVGANAAIGQPKKLFGVLRLVNYAVAPDGRLLIAVPSQQENPPTIVMTNWLETLRKSAQ